MKNNKHVVETEFGDITVIPGCPPILNSPWEDCYPGDPDEYEYSDETLKNWWIEKNWDTDDFDEVFKIYYTKYPEIPDEELDKIENIEAPELKELADKYFEEHFDEIDEAFYDWLADNLWEYTIEEDYGPDPDKIYDEWRDRQLEEGNDLW